ncbi:MAG TPA: type II toxin-antitoxin system RelE/ParE family toxin [bacterium]|nr:type II toxin-antitoxin system RelE/ParE family toxin [bacterium]
MILSWGNDGTRKFFETGKAKWLGPDVRAAAARKLDMLNAAAGLDDLAAAPGNRLEKLSGDLKGFYSIRINDQFRVIFRWQNGNALDVKIIDYH